MEPSCMLQTASNRQKMGSLKCCHCHRPWDVFCAISIWTCSRSVQGSSHGLFHGRVLDTNRYCLTLSLLTFYYITLLVLPDTLMWFIYHTHFGNAGSPLFFFLYKFSTLNQFLEPFSIMLGRKTLVWALISHECISVISLQKSIAQLVQSSMK